MEEVGLEGAQGVLSNIPGGRDMPLHEITRAIEEQVNTKADSEANIIFGSVIDENMADQMKVTILATGFNRMEPAAERAMVQEKELEPMHVTPQQYSNFDDPPYLHKRRPEARREREVAPVPAAEPEREIEAEAVPFSRMNREDILPSIFGNFK
jgi:cell division protein FtsZ